MNPSKFYAFVLNPWVVIISLGAGVAFGMLAPALATTLGFVGDIYVDLLKMITLPFMVSAVIFSLQRLFRDGGTASLLGRVALVFLAFSAFVAIAGAATLLILRPGENLPASTMQTFGQIVGGDLSASDTAMNLRGVDEVKKTASFADMLVSLVPANIFSALANGDTLKTLVFALLFGLAVGHVPTRISDGLTQALETVYHACQTLMRWLSFPLPVVLFCMSAAQLGKTGIEPLRAMGAFVLAFLVVSVLLLAVACVIIWKRSNGTLGQTLNAMRGPFALALATRSSATCMPIMIESLVTRLGFARSRVELLVPLTVSLLRIGPVVYYVCATLFIAQIYGRSLSAVEIGIVLTSSVLAGFASAGMTGLVTVSLIGMTCTYLGLPFEAAFILFLAVDPVCDMLRTLVLVIGNTAAVAVVCPRPLKI
ncbi:dicarboxylate/amino acid:cation symporter [Variovorax sp. PAMC26660]|uniref:dicarboxylate/amino acid:cation symporter n=1 Tax=Variovorax sp. PAMC26660 TaxID=2762322 RepID=UPI00164E8857|nr:cation:dicarboxylase symporter family transporter [Variovorax sp. PAMC26660]QNK68943.1 cation:dicarboxylase symporter family transporter [Variovorax sp. PAMC26660]